MIMVLDNQLMAVYLHHRFKRCALTSKSLNLRI